MRRKWAGCGKVAETARAPADRRWGRGPARLLGQPGRPLLSGRPRAVSAIVLVGACSGTIAETVWAPAETVWAVSAIVPERAP